MTRIGAVVLAAVVMSLAVYWLAGDVAVAIYHLFTR